MYSTGDITLVLPYISIDETKYIPLFYWNGIIYKSIQISDLYNSSINLNHLNLAYLNFYCNVHICNNTFFCFGESLFEDTIENMIITLYPINTINKIKKQFLTDIFNMFKIHYLINTNNQLEIYNLVNAYFENNWQLIVHHTIMMEQLKNIESKNIKPIKTESFSITILIQKIRANTIQQGIQFTNITNQNEKSTNQMVHIKYLIN